MGETIVNTGSEGLLEILRCGLERSAEQRTAIQLGDRSQYVGMSDIGKMLDCPRAALAGKLFVPEYRDTAGAHVTLKTKKFTLLNKISQTGVI